MTEVTIKFASAQLKKRGGKGTFGFHLLSRMKVTLNFSLIIKENFSDNICIFFSGESVNFQGNSKIFQDFPVPLIQHFIFKHFSRTSRTCTNPVLSIKNFDLEIANIYLDFSF